MKSYKMVLVLAPGVLALGVLALLGAEAAWRAHKAAQPERSGCGVCETEITFSVLPT